MNTEIESEQRYIDRAYERLEAQRAQAVSISEGGLDLIGVGTGQALLERDAFMEHGLRRLKDLEFGDLPLVFGRIDRKDGETLYIGRAAVYDDEQHPLVVDWRAPAAEAFYRATALDSMGVVRRRHFICRGPRIAKIEDEVLSRSRRDGMVLMGEGALIDALDRSRSSRMRDIVATIQREQDEVIRAPVGRTLVVQGGPGTGKTVVALHRAAYLLYTHRRDLERSGVLFLGPTALFLRYVEDVLPSLGEQSATFSTPVELAGAKADRTEARAVAAIKGDVRMARMLKNALASYERPLGEALVFLYEEYLLRIMPEATRSMVERLRKAPGGHNDKRVRLEKAVVDEAFSQYLEHTGRPARRAGGRRRSERDPDWKSIHEHLRGKKEFRAALGEMWPRLTPERLVLQLLESRDRLASSGDRLLSSDELGLLQSNSIGSGWAEADLALLDEARTLVEGTRRRKPARSRGRSQNEELADRVLEDLESSVGIDPEMRRFLRDRLESDRVDEEDGPQSRPRSFYGYTIVDEAQELSPMQWRMVARRSPRGWITIVGDLGQATGPSAPSSWSEVLHLVPAVEPFTTELTVNYRSTREVMEFAARLLPEGVRPPVSVRKGGHKPQLVSCGSEELRSCVLSVSEEFRKHAGEGTVAVLAPSSLIEEVRGWLGVSELRGILDEPVVTLSPREAKGLEFDAAVVVEPLSIVEEAGTERALYVCLTRPTKFLAVVHSRGMPEQLTLDRAHSD